MSAPPEHHDHLVEAVVTHKSGPGCGCLGWAVFAVVFLLAGGSAIGVWRPLLVLPIAFIVIGAGLWTVYAVLRNGRVRRGRYDPRNEDWHPAALLDDDGGVPASPGDRPARADTAPAALSGAVADVAPAVAAAPADPAPPRPAAPAGDPAPPPSAAPSAGDLAPARSVAGVTTAGLSDAPQAPEAPEAPASPWT